jgi:hypothetical protein
MSLSLETIENRIKQYEEEIMKVVANHTGLMATLAELKQLLSVASEAAVIVAPEAVPVIDTIEGVVHVIDEIVTSVDESVVPA